MIEIAKEIAAKFNFLNSVKKCEFLFIYEDYFKVEVLKQKFEIKRCENNLKLVNESEFPAEQFELVFGDFTIEEESNLSEDLFLTDLSSDESPEIIIVEENIEEKKELPKKRVLFPVSWNQMIENKRNSLKKMIDKSVLVTPSSFENKKKLPFGFKDCDLEDISPDEHSFDFKTPQSKKAELKKQKTYPK